MSRAKFLLILALAAAGIAAGSLACIDSTVDLDREDETEGAT